MKTRMTVLLTMAAIFLGSIASGHCKGILLPEPVERPIDLVICLDTSNSMDGLIGAAKIKLWDIVNELGRAHPRPHLRVGLYTYGTPSYGVESGYVRKEIDLTDDLDSVYAKLTALVKRRRGICRARCPGQPRPAVERRPAGPQDHRGGWQRTGDAGSEVQNARCL